MANHLDDLLTHQSGPIALIGITGDILHLARVCVEVVQFVDIETVPNVLPVFITHHHVGSELFRILSTMINRVKTGDFGEDWLAFRLSSIQNRISH